MDAQEYLRNGGTLEESMALGDALHASGPRDRVERAALLLSDGQRYRAFLREPENNIRNGKPGAEILAPVIAYVREHFARELRAADRHSKRMYRRWLEVAEARRTCPKRNARARAFNAWLRPALFAQSLSTKTYRFSPEAGELSDRDLIDAAEGHTGNFGGSVSRTAHGVRVTINTD